jgi:macrolide transport system ATP-binding/permease protein
MMNGMAQDFWYAIRQLQKNPGFTCTVVLMLALGISACAALFGFVDAALIRPLPYRDASRLVSVFTSNAMESRFQASYLDFTDWRNLNHVFSSIDAYSANDAANGGFMLSTPTGAQQVAETRVTPGFFHTLGVSPVLGRDFYSNEDSPEAAHTVMLSYPTWQKRFGGRPNVLGESVVLEGVPSIIIGVLPRDFHFAPVGPAEFWGIVHASDYCEQFRGCRNLNTVARIKEEVSIQTAMADMKSVALQLERQYPESNRDEEASVVPLSEVIVGKVRSLLLVLLGGAGLLLLIALFNAMNLLLARSASRTREIAVRAALGASGARLIRQFAAEGLVLVIAGGLLGVVSAVFAMQFLTKLIPADMIGNMPYLRGLGLNVHVLVFACAASLVAGVQFALTPFLRVPLSRLPEGLSEGGRSSVGTMWRRFGSKLVVLELATATVLLVGAGLLDKSLYRLLQEEVGFEPDHLATLQIEGPIGVQGTALAREVVGRIASLPGVKSVGISSTLPVGTGWGVGRFQITGRPDHGERDEAFYRQVSPGYFITLQARLLRGRYFTEAEDVSRPRVVIINQALAKQYFSGEGPIGKYISYFGEPKSAMQIVGIVGDIKEGPLDTKSRPALYEPFNQDPWRGFSIVVRTAQTEHSLLPTLLPLMHQIDPGISVHDEITMTDLINESPSAYLHRSSAWLVGSFAVAAFLLSVVGLYGVVTYSVSQRIREIGVRIALGAQRGSVYLVILKEAAWLAATGTALGLVGSVAVARMTRSLLYNVQSWDVPTLVGVAVILVVASMVASYIPARRATKVDPMVALRYE